MNLPVQRKLRESLAGNASPGYNMPGSNPRQPAGRGICPGGDMTRGERYFRPPSEAESFLIRVMHGCPHNACTFCNLFKSVRFRPVPVQEVLDGLDRDAAELGPVHIDRVTSIFLEGGDPLALRTARLLRIMEHAKQRFPCLRRFACYATARFGVRKSQQDLNSLARAGLRRVFVGLESGCAPILEHTKKGCTPDELARAGEKFFLAGIEMDVSMMLGIGGRELSERHAVESARLLNAISPACVRIRTFTAKSGTSLGEDYLQGRFAYLSPHEILRELRRMVEHIASAMELLSEHWTNFIHFRAAMPGAKQELLAYIDQALGAPEDSFRPLGITDARG